MANPPNGREASKELIGMALRVLVAWNHGRKPASADLTALKEAFPSSAHLANDDLACQVIHDLSVAVFHQPAANVERGRIIADRVA